MCPEQSISISGITSYVLKAFAEDGISVGSDASGSVVDPELD